MNSVKLSSELEPEKLVAELAAWLAEADILNEAQRAFWGRIVGAFATDAWYQLSNNNQSTGRHANRDGMTELGAIYEPNIGAPEGSRVVVLPQIFRRLPRDESGSGLTGVRVVIADESAGKIGEVGLNIAHATGEAWPRRGWVTRRHGDLDKPRNPYKSAIKRILGGYAGFNDIRGTLTMSGEEEAAFMTEAKALVAEPYTYPHVALTANFTSTQALESRAPRLAPIQSSEATTEE